MIENLTITKQSSLVPSALAQRHSLLLFGPLSHSYQDLQETLYQKLANQNLISHPSVNTHIWSLQL